MSFQLDTSGSVMLPSWDADGKPYEGGLPWFWHTLAPLMQGYVEAAARAASLLAVKGFDLIDGEEVPRMVAFSDLAPETLARIVEDCAALILFFGAAGDRRATVEDGRQVWADRQHHNFEGFPPLTAYLGDDGKVYLREAV